MPFFHITTNTKVEPSAVKRVAQEASRYAAELLGKPESYVMVRIETEQELIFGGSGDPACYVTLKSLGLPQEKTEVFSQGVCDFVHQELGIDPDRIYIEFSSPERHMWGFNRKTFRS